MKENQKQRPSLGFARLWTGIGLGVLVSVAFGGLYLVVLREPGSVFYLFAGLVFPGGALAGGLAAALKAPARRRAAFLAASAAVLGIAGLLFIFVYLVLPQFARTSVQLPAFCDGLNASDPPPPELTYTWPDGSTGILITSDARTAVVAVVDPPGPPFASTVFVVNKSANKIVRGMRFNTDVISAMIADDLVYIYNDKLGFLIDAQTGGFEDNLLLIDNFGGLSDSDRPFFRSAASGHWYLETTAVISSWNVNGTVKSRPRLTFNGIARGCFVAGATNAVTKL